MDFSPLEFSQSLVSFIAILNPFALALYLSNLMDELDRKQFFYVLSQASLIIGAISIDMITTGLKQLWLRPLP